VPVAVDAEACGPDRGHAPVGCAALFQNETDCFEVKHLTHKVEPVALRIDGPLAVVPLAINREEDFV
jgi:hypothetical protein